MFPTFKTFLFFHKYFLYNNCKIMNWSLKQKCHKYISNPNKKWIKIEISEVACIWSEIQTLQNKSAVIVLCFDWERVNDELVKQRLVLTQAWPNASPAITWANRASAWAAGIRTATTSTASGWTSPTCGPETTSSRSEVTQSNPKHQYLVDEPICIEVVMKCWVDTSTVELVMIRLSDTVGSSG